MSDGGDGRACCREGGLRRMGKGGAHEVDGSVARPAVQGIGCCTGAGRHEETGHVAAAWCVEVLGPRNCAARGRKALGGQHLTQLPERVVAGMVGLGGHPTVDLRSGGWGHHEQSLEV